MSNIVSITITLLGGLGLFIYGMQLCSEGLQKLAAHRLKHYIKMFTSNRMLGMAIGTLVTVCFQGSSATTALVVGFVSAGMMSLTQALSILLGSAIGTSLTLQLIAFKLTGLALTLIFIGVCLSLFAKRSREQNLGRAILGFGILFYGMTVMTEAMAPVKNFPFVVQALTRMEQYPAVEFIFAFILSALIQSSPAFLALVMSLSGHNLVGIYSIVPYVLGSHLGGTITGLLSSVGAKGTDAVRAAVTNVIFKLMNGLMFLPFYIPLTKLILGNETDMSRAIANCHTFFSIAMAIMFTPFLPGIVKMVERFIPDRQSRDEQAFFLDEHLSNLPELALEQAHLQTLELGRLIGKEMFDSLIPLIRYRNDDGFERISAIEKLVDTRYKQISSYLSRLGKDTLQDEFVEKSIQILYVAKDLEHIGDIFIEMQKKLKKIHNDNLELSEAGLNEIEEIFTRAYDNYRQSLQAFESMDPNLAVEIIKKYPKTLRLEKILRYNHFDRIQCGNKKTIATSAIHLDLVEALLRIDGHTVDISQVVMGNV